MGAVYKTSHGESQLSKNKEEEIKNNYLKIFNYAIKRYYQLRLYDIFRSFKLKHIVLNLLFKNKKRIYYFKYINLILHYPIAPGNIEKNIIIIPKKRKERIPELNNFFSLNQYSNYSGRNMEVKM